MKITKDQPPAVYTLQLNHAELRELYHLLDERYYGTVGLRGATLELYGALKEHA